MTSVKNWRVILAATALASAAGCTQAAKDGGEEAASEDHVEVSMETAKDDIWALEQAIYAGRSKGDISAYVDNLADGYLSWPPMYDAPMDPSGFNRGEPDPAMTHEKLAMELKDFTLHGETAIIYYQTHMTMRADGTPVDNWFDVTHTWVLQDGQWRVLGGMARPRTMP